MATTTFLQGLNAPDLGLFINGEDFAATTDMTETLNQTVTYGDAFGTDGPVLRTVRYADENTVTFTATLLKTGVANGLNSEDTLKALRDFEIITRRGDDPNHGHHVYDNCNWTSIVITSGVDSVTLQATISVPGFSVQSAGFIALEGQT
jgi:hypothetical protein